MVCLRNMCINTLHKGDNDNDDDDDDDNNNNNNNIIIRKGRDSSVGIATRYGLHGPRIESRWGEIFRTCPDRPWGPPSLLYNGYRVFPGGKAAEAWS